MKAMAMLALLGALGALEGYHTAQAAVTCVENKSTGRFDEKVSSRSGTTGECDAQLAMNRASSSADMEMVASTGGTKIIDGVIVTNAAQPFGAIGNTKKAPDQFVLTGNMIDARTGKVVPPPAPPATAAPQVRPAAVAQVAAVVPAPQPAKLVAPAGPEKRLWDVRVDDRTILSTLTRWGAMAVPKRQIAWELPREFELTAGDSDKPFYGTFEEAVDRVLDSFENSDYPPKGCFYNNGVLRVVRRVGDGMECKH